jgi:Xaa-Pro aminopeptidase
MKTGELQEWMRGHGVDASIFLNIEKNANHFYFTQSTATGALVVSQRSSEMIISKLDYSRTERYAHTAKVWGKGRLLDFAQNPLRRAKTIGIDKESVSAAMLLKLKERFKARFIDISGICAELRTTKTEDEIETLRQASRITHAIIQECLVGWDRFKTELDVLRQLKMATIEHGCELAFEPIVACRGNASIPHHKADKTKLKGFCIIDFGVKHKGYCADVTKTVHVGKAQKKEQMLYGQVLEAQHEIIRHMRAGVMAQELYAIADKKLGRHLIHSAGHGVGIEVHEQPAISETNIQCLKQEMVLAIEPAYYSPGKFGIRIEDMVLVKKHRAVMLTKTSAQELMIV